MANSQTKEEKARFFSDLEKLCESESESDHDVSIMASSQRLYQTDLRSQHVVSKPKVTDTHTRKLSDQMSVTSIADVQGASRTSFNQSAVPASASRLPSNVVLLTQSTTTSLEKAKMKRSYPDKLDSSNKVSAKKAKVEAQAIPEERKIFRGLTFFFVPNDEIAKPRKMRIQKAREFGAQRATCFDHNVSHVIVEPNIEYSEAAKAFPNLHIPEGTTVVKSTWLTESLGSMFLRDVTQSRFQLTGAPPVPNLLALPKSVAETVEMSKETLPLEKIQSQTGPEGLSQVVSHDLENIIAQIKNAGPMPEDSDHEETNSFSSIVSETSFDSRSSVSDEAPNKNRPKNNVGFQCMESNDGSDNANPNAKTIAILQEMATYYDRTGDHWRTTAYRKAIGALRKQRTLIATREQALAIPQLGTRLADKIEEIVTTNRLRRLESTKDDPHAELLQLFMGIYDVGHKQASQWIAQGHRTLEDLLQNVKLTPNQRVGIAHYDDFLQRIPRDEVSQHAAIVQRACHTADKDLQVIVGGSYRRGNTDSGDIDLVITKPGADITHIRALLASHVIPSLTAAGFLKHALVSSSSHAQLSGSKWHGACGLPTSTVWRRIDLLFVPGDELGAALLYFTGNDIFNRSMRLLASRKGMRLNQHGLYENVMRGKGRVKITEGTLLEAKDESRIFEILGVPWREPWERKC